MKKISIITVNLNNAANIRRTLDSVSSQTYENMEWIVVDGASTDGSMDIINEYKSRISVLISEPDTGIYNAMNKGVRHATGEYCLFMNTGDTFVDKRSLEKAVKTGFDKDLAIFGEYLNDSNKKFFLTPHVINFLSLMMGAFPHQSTFIKRELLVKTPYDESYTLVADWVFFFEELHFQGCTYSVNSLCISRFYSGGASSVNDGLDTIGEGKRYLQCHNLSEMVSEMETEPLRTILSILFFEPILYKICFFLIRCIKKIDSIVFSK